MTQPKQIALAIGLSCLACATLSAQLNFQHLYGDELNNSFHRIIDHSGDYYLLGSEESLAGTAPHATFSRINTDGTLQWMTRLAVPSRWNDVVVTDNGDFLLVGHTLPNNTFTNSLIALATADGAFVWVRSYNLGTGEALVDIGRNLDPQSTNFPYYISGSRLQSASVDDVMLLQIDESGNIGNANLVGSTNSDESFTTFLPLPSGELLFYGHHGNFAVTYRTDNRGDRLAGKAYASKMRILHAALVPDGSGVILGGSRNETSLAQITRIDQNLDPIWSRTIPQLSRITRLQWVGTDQLYALGFGTVNGVSRNVLVQFTIGTGGTVINWVRYLDGGEMAHTGGYFNLMLPNHLVYVDGRTGHPDGFGGSDGFVSVSDLNLSTCISQDLPLTLNTVNLPSDEYFNNRDGLTVDLPLTVNSQNINKQTAVVCQSLLLLSPLGEIVWEEGQPLEFSWTPQINYSGAYRLKIMELELEDPIPDQLPDTGLFFERSDIAETTFAYPANGPVFQADRRYAWQIETLDPANLGKSQVGWISVVSLLNCGMEVSGVPDEVLCPGDCFALDVQFDGFSLSEKHLLFYTDHPNPTAVIINDTGQPYLLDDLDAEILESPPHFSGIGAAASVNICILEGVDGPVEFSLYQYRPGSACSADPLGDDCCYDIFDFSVEVADIPDFTDLQLTIKDPTGITSLTEICSGDPVQFGIESLPVPAAIQWQCNVGEGWEDISGTPFLLTDDYFFTQPGHPVLSLDCGTSATGYTDKVFRASITVGTGTGQCEYFTTEYPLRICCPLTSGELEITTDDPVDLSLGICEGSLDVINLQITLTSDHPFVSTPGELLDIAWELNGDPLPDFTDQTSFELTTTVGSEDLVLTAVLTNCVGKSMSLQECIHVDPQPQRPTLTSSKEVICPGEDAVLTASGVENCIPHWEYSFDQIAWVAMGSVSNIVQNTNPLIPEGFECIYYRVRCEPLPDVGGCDPNPEASACEATVSDTVKITEIQPPQIPIVENCIPAVACTGGEILFAISAVEPNVNYTWYVNGLPVGEGIELLYTIEEDICYWVEAANECITVVSETCCLSVCAVQAVISCPLPPNECAFLGQPISLSADGSTSSCTAEELSYLWTWTDAAGSHEATAVTINPTPDPQGTIYTLTVTDETGCSDTTSLTIIPCA